MVALGCRIGEEILLGIVKNLTHDAGNMGLVDLQQSLIEDFLQGFLLNPDMFHIEGRIIWLACIR